MAVDAIAGTNGTQQILDDAGTGTYLGVAFTGVTTLGSLQAGGVISTAALRGQVWLTSGSRLAVGVGLVGLGLNAADEGALWLRTMQGDCAAFGEWAALQQLGAADGLLPFGDVLAAGMLLPKYSNETLAIMRWEDEGGNLASGAYEGFVETRNRDIRRWYRAQVGQIDTLNQQWIQQGLSLRNRAYRAWEIRHSARLQARGMMPDKSQVDELRFRDWEKYQNPDGPTFEQLIQNFREQGLSDNDIYEAIINGSQRTDRATNQRYN